MKGFHPDLYSIRTKLLAVLTVVFAMNVAGGLIVSRGVTAQKADSVVINVAGAQRMLSHRMTKEALLLLQSEGPARVKQQAQLIASAAKFQKVLSGLRAGSPDLGLPPCGEPKILAELDKVDQLWAPFQAAVKSFAANPSAKSPDLAVLLSSNMPLLEAMNGLVKLFEQQAEAKVAGVLRTQAIVIGASMIAGFTLVLWLAGRIAAPLRQMVLSLERVAKGDLTAEPKAQGRDEVGKIGEAVRIALGSLRSTLTNVQAAVGNVSVAAEELSRASEQLSYGAQTSAANLEETAAGLTQMTANVETSCEEAGRVSKFAAEARTTAENGGSLVSKAVSAMTELQSSSARISDIVSTIDEIAFQTNLLALNAAVEAARAGESGRGFAVVAGEVRALSQRTASAAKEIKALIGDSLAKIESGAQLVNRSGSSLQQIIQEVGRVTDSISGIAAASAEQSDGLRQLNRALTQMEGVTQSTASQTEELAATAESLKEQAGLVRGLVASFQLA